MKRVAIFGAGVYGQIALKSIGEEKVEYFIDNSLQKQGTLYCGKRVISLEEFIVNKDSCQVVVASIYSASIIKQLKGAGISEYSVFTNSLHGYYETEDLIINPYQEIGEATSEAEWNAREHIQYGRKAVYDEAEELYGIRKLFNHIEVETINRCNGNCSFCPVNHKIDMRKETIMTRDLFEKIVNQLAEIDYAGRFTTFSNNEPLLDDRIVELNQFARKRLPKARIHLFTNGTLMTLDIFAALMEVLDELVIDNYHQELKLIKPCVQIQEYCELHPELKRKVTIVLRKPNEILTSRGGTAPNRNELVEYGEDRCVLPFKQIIVRPDGKISLCCNDALGKYTLGDLNKEKLLDIWYGPRFQMVRKCLYEGRANWGDCKYCDVFSVG